jgi:tetratricopeptide (TPR) repeat protein
VVEPLAGEIEGLRALFRSERDPEGRAFVPLADAYRRTHDLKRALQVLSEGLEQHPELASAHVVSAWIHRDRGDRASARAAWKRVLELDEENVEALRGLGKLLVDSGQADEARAYLEKLRLLDPEDPDVHGQLARLEAERPPGVPSPAGEALAVEGVPGAEVPLQDWAAPAEEPPLVAAGAAALVESATEPEGTAHAEPRDLDEPAAPVPAAALLEAEAVEREKAEAALESDLRLEVEAPPAEPHEEPVVIAAGAEVLLGDGEIMDVWGEGAPDDEEGSEPAELPATRTLGELFARQGLHARAAAIFERLIEESPEDDRLRDRLDELRGLLRPKAAPHPPSVHAEDTEAIAAEMGGVHAEPTASPFGWAPDDAGTDEVEGAEDGGAPISLYFRRLLEWTPAAGAAPALAEVPSAPIEGAHVESVEVDGHEVEVFHVDVVPVDLAPLDLAPMDAAPADVAPVDVASVDVEAVDAASVDLAPLELPSTDVLPVDAPDVALADVGVPEVLAPSLGVLSQDVSGMDVGVLEPAAVVEDRFEGILEETAILEVVPIRSLAPDRIVPIEDLAPSPVVPIAALAPDAVPIESLAPDAEPSHDSSTILF